MPSTVNWQERYNAAFIMTIRVRVRDVPGKFAATLSAIGQMGAPVGDIRMIEADSRFLVRDIQIFFTDREHIDRTIEAVQMIAEVEILHACDDVLEIHRGGAIETSSRVPLDSIMDLRMVYTPGVATVCDLIARNPRTAWDYTGISNRISIVTNGTAVLGLGDIGPLAALPVMEGKSAILAHYVGVSADPMLIDSKDIDEIVNIVAKTAHNYGAIQLEDIAAPACFEIETRLQECLDIPVFHDDQHGTATVCVAGLLKALEHTDRTPADVRGVVLGAGAAGLAIARFLVDLGVDDVILCDSRGAVHEGRADGMNRWKNELAAVTNRHRQQGALRDVIAGKNLFVGVSRPGLVDQDMIRSMEDGAIVFALANPVSEIPPQEALDAGAAVALDGRGMNNALAYPGIFRGALDARATSITREMKLAAAKTLAAAAGGDNLLPDMLDRTVHERVARAVAAAWKPAT